MDSHNIRMCHGSVTIEDLIHIGKGIFTNGVYFVFRIAKHIISLRFINDGLDCSIYTFEHGIHTSDSFSQQTDYDTGGLNADFPNIFISLPHDMLFVCSQLHAQKPQFTYTLHIHSLPQLITCEQNCALSSSHLTSVHIESREDLMSFMENICFDEFYTRYTDAETMSRHLNMVKENHSLHALNKGEFWSNMIHIGDGLFLYKGGVVCRIGKCIIRANDTFEAFLFSNESKVTTLRRFYNGLFFIESPKHIYDMCNLNISLEHSCSKYKCIATPIYTGCTNPFNYYVSLHIDNNPVFKVVDSSRKKHPKKKTFCDDKIWTMYRIPNDDVLSVLKKHKKQLLESIYNSLILIKRINE